MNTQEINRYLKDIIGTMNEGLLLVAPDGTMLMVNKAFEELTGTSRKRWWEDPARCFIATPVRPLSKRMGRPGAAFSKRGQVIKKRCSIIKKDGSCLPVLKNASLLKDDEGLPLGAVETLMDISELERLDQEVYHLSHQLEIKNGFHGIVGSSPLMQKTYQVAQKAALSDATGHHLWRKRHREGIGCQGHSSYGQEKGRAFRAAQLRSAQRGAARKRALRPHQRGLHRSLSSSNRPFRGSPRRGPFS